VILGIDGPSHGTLFVQSGTRSREGFHANRSDSITADRVAGSWLRYAAPASLFGGSWFEGWGASSDAERVLRVVWRSGASAQTDSILLELSSLASFDAGDGGSFGTSSIFDVAAKWEWPKDALLGDAFVVTSSAATAPDLAPGLTLHGRPFRAEPMDLPLSKQMTLTAIAPTGAVSDPRHLGIFRVWSDGEIEPLSSGDELSAKTWLLGTFALIEDQSPPKITRMRPASGSTITSTRPKLTIDVVDEGKGIDDEATRFVLDGQRLIAEYDPEANVITAKPKAALARGVHTLEVTIRDEAGHETSRTSEFTVGAAKSRPKKGR
jgi:hypothetical protein